MQEEIIRQLEVNNNKIENIEEKQELLGDSLQNKYNQLSKTIGKIHQNVKSNNYKHSQLMDELNQLKQIMENNNIEKKITNLLEQIKQPETEQEQTDKVLLGDYKKILEKWFNKNIKITKNPHDMVDIENIKDKLDNYLQEEQININKETLYNRLESYMKYWFNKHNKDIQFEDIISISIKNKTLYSYLKFIDINEERENSIKNSVKAWLKEYTCEVEGSKTYTEDILKNIQPLFEKNGWIITTPDEYNQLQQAGFTKVCVKRTFSQIIGKAVQEQYNHITKDTIQRDTPGNGNVTWYPNIKIIDRRITDNIQVTIKDHLSGDIFESDNMVCKWLTDNLKYTGNNKDITSQKEVITYLRRYLKEEDAMISEDTLERIVESMLEKLAQQYNASYENGDCIREFKLVDKSNLEEIITSFIESHIQITGNRDDKVSLSVLDEKLITTLYKENIIIVKDGLYQQLPESIKSNFIPETLYKNTTNDILNTKLHEYIRDNSFIEQAKIIRYNNLKREDVTLWVKENIDNILEKNVYNKNQIIENFRQYMKNTNKINNTNKKLEQLVDEEIKAYYEEVNITLKLLKDSEEEYYALIY